MVERNGQWAHGRGVAWRTLVRTIRTIRTFFVTVRTICKLTRLNTHTAKSDLVENDLHYYHCVLMERMALSLILPVANDFLPLPSGQICPDIRTVCPDGDLGALRAALARPSSSRFLVRVDRRATGAPGSHEDLGEATAPIPQPSLPSTHGRGSDDSASVTMMLAA